MKLKPKTKLKNIKRIAGILIAEIILPFSRLLEDNLVAIKLGTFLAILCVLDILLILISAWFTSVIDLHVMFSGLLLEIFIPHEYGKEI